MSDNGYTDPKGRRRHPRLEARAKAEVYFVAERVIPVELMDLSYEGMRIKGEQQDFDRMLPALRQGDSYDRVPLRICFTVNTNSQQQAVIQILASSVYLKNTPTDGCQMGLEFVDVEEGVLELAEYIQGL